MPILFRVVQQTHCFHLLSGENAVCVFYTTVNFRIMKRLFSAKGKPYRLWLRCNCLNPRKYITRFLLNSSLSSTERTLRKNGPGSTTIDSNWQNPMQNQLNWMTIKTNIETNQCGCHYLKPLYPMTTQRNFFSVNLNYGEFFLPDHIINAHNVFRLFRFRVVDDCCLCLHPRIASAFCKEPVHASLCLSFRKY